MLATFIFNFFPEHFKLKKKNNNKTDHSSLDTHKHRCKKFR